MNNNLYKRLDFLSNLNEDGYLDKIVFWLKFTLLIIFILNVYFMSTIDFNKKIDLDKISLQKKKTE